VSSRSRLTVQYVCTLCEAVNTALDMTCYSSISQTVNGLPTVNRFYRLFGGSIINIAALNRLRVARNLCRNWAPVNRHKGLYQNLPASPIPYPLSPPIESALFSLFFVTDPGRNGWSLFP
jgi:hypothetical protein